MVLKMLGCAFCWICSAPITVVGVGAVKPLDVMRDPVTTMSDDAGGVSSSAALLCSEVPGAAGASVA